MKSTVLEALRRMEAERDAEIMTGCEKTIKDYLATHPGGKPSVPMNNAEFADFLAFTTAKSTLIKMEKKYMKMAAASAAEELLKEPEVPSKEDDAKTRSAAETETAEKNGSGFVSGEKITSLLDSLVLMEEEAEKEKGGQDR